MHASSPILFFGRALPLRSHVAKPSGDWELSNLKFATILMPVSPMWFSSRPTFCAPGCVDDPVACR